MGDLREQLAELAHIAEAERKTVDVEQLGVKSRQRDNRGVEPITRQCVARVKFAVELRARPLADLSRRVLDESVALALTCQSTFQS